MANNSSENQGAGEITSEIRAGTLAEQTIYFIRLQLPAWRDQPNRINELAEKKLNAQLCRFLENRARQIFPMMQFSHEEPQTGQASVDMSVTPVESMVIGAKTYTIDDPILVLEGKRLPADRLSREREYITGNESKNGGIQRFKLGIHGALLDVAGMIGYIQSESPQYWHQCLNSWISDLASGNQQDMCRWEAEEALGSLEEDESDGVAHCLSAHGRTGKVHSNRIRLHHLWIVMNRG